MTIEENKKVKEEQIVDDGSRKRETSPDFIRESKFGIDQARLLRISSDRDEVALDGQCKLEAELEMKDNSVIPITTLVNWKIAGTANVSIDREGRLFPKKEKGIVIISASYRGVFSNDVFIRIIEPIEPIKKKN